MTTSNKRIYYLDFIRAAATLLIILFHFLAGVEDYQLLQNPDMFKIGGISLLNIGGVNLTLGNYAVSLFFIISGAGLMQRYGEKLETKEFYRKRALSIYPLYYTAFVAAFLIQLIVDKGLDHGSHLWTFLLTILGIDGWLGEQIPNYGLVGDWFVGCIICIYLIFPYLRKWMNKNPHKTIIIYALIFLLWEFVYPFDFPKRNDVILRGFEVALGMYFVKTGKKVTWKGLGIAVILLGAIFAVRMPWISVYVLVPIAGMSLFMVLNFISKWFEFNWIKKIVNWLAEYSFPIFLLHHFLLNTIMEQLPQGCLSVVGMLGLFVVCVMVILAAGTAIKKVEMLLKNVEGYEKAYASYVGKILLAAAVILYLGRFVWLAFTQIPGFDGAMNLQVPVSLLRNGTYATTYDGGALFAGRIQTGAPVLLLITFLFKIFGTGMTQALMANALYIALLIFFVYKITKLLKVDRLAVVILMGTTMVLWSYLELAMGIYGELPTLALFLGCIYFLLLAEQTEKKGYFALAGLFFGLAYLTKTVILIAVPALGVVFLSKWLWEKRAKFLDLLLWAIGAVAPVAVFEGYKFSQLGWKRYVASWSNQSGNILMQAGVKSGYEDTANIIEKFFLHLSVFEETFNIQVGALLVVLVLNFIWLVCKVVKRKKLEYMDIVELLVYSYFGWWLLITPTEKAWGRRIIIGLFLLEWICCMKSCSLFEKLVEQGKIAISAKAKAMAGTVIGFFSIIFIIFGMWEYDTIARQGVMAMADVVSEKAENEDAVICGIGWWQAPVVAFASGIDFVDLETLDVKEVQTPVYFVADSSFFEEAEMSMEEFPYPMELVFEEEFTGQQLYKVRINTVSLSDVRNR